MQIHWFGALILKVSGSTTEPLFRLKSSVLVSREIYKYLWTAPCGKSDVTACVLVGGNVYVQ